jgi:sodium-coupled monocarboxylate transporter 8/12
MVEKRTLSVVDYVVFAASLLGALGIGVWGAITGRRYNAEESLAKAKGISLIPITLSLLATYLSAVTLVG